MIKTMTSYDQRVTRRITEVPMCSSVVDVLRCPECKRWLVRGPTAWVCWKGHGKMVYDLILKAKVEKAIEDARWSLASGETVLREFLAEQEREEKS